MTSALAELTATASTPDARAFATITERTLRPVPVPVPQPG